MRLKILLLFLLFYAVGILKAQDTIRTLIISEARIDNMHAAYVELTNVGATSVNLSEFEFGKVSPWTPVVTTGTTADWFQVGTGDWFMLPNVVLAPGESFVMAKVNDFCTKMWAIKPDQYNRYESKPEMFELADMQIHIGESPVAVPQSLDSISPYASAFTVWNGSYCWYLRHHVTTGDSVVVDQVGGIFDDTDFTSLDVMHDVAGVTNATGNCVLIRKANVTQGNIDFNTGRGTNPVESEWIAVPHLLGGWEPNRAVFWTVHNHGDYHLSSLTSSTMTVNWTDSTLTVPWGVRNDDSIMYQFTRVPGIAWHYDYAKNHDDSAFVSVRTGDKLTVYGCGNAMEKVVFKITALPPTASDNKVIPKNVPNNRGWYAVESGPFCEVTDNAPVIDSILAIAYATRVDTLLKYLEKPADATWQLIWVDGVPRASLKKGDILRVTSQNGTPKDYYIKTRDYWPSHDAYLSSITWPDIPDFYKGIYGWIGDTIPNFVSSKYTYKVTVPWDVDGIPALLGKKAQLNAKLQVDRALNLSGSPADRTVTFTNTAEDDTTINVYKVELVKEKDPVYIQPWAGEPFISQYIFQQDFNNYFCEIVNPGTEILDLSNYMLFFGYVGSAAEAIQGSSGAGDFNVRYKKYIPGYKWVDATTWASTPGVAEVDPAIFPFVEPGDVFVTAMMFSDPSALGYPAFVIPQIDIDFNHNPWGDDLTVQWDGAMRQWVGGKALLFKILNDSVKNGLKPANDPADFILIDEIGSTSGDWASQVTSYSRRPEIYKGSDVIGNSYDAVEANSEWTIMNETRYQDLNYGWPDWRRMVADGIGSHFMNEVTLYKSTIASNVYKISPGYSNNESVRGVGAGISVDNFLANIIKADAGQQLTMKKASDGSILTGTDILSDGDTLIVVSTDMVNTSKYILDFTPLDNDAVLTSTTYTININGSTGTISNFAFGTNLKTIVEGVTVPATALMVVVDGTGAYQPLKILNYDTTYVDVKVNDQIKFVVTAEDGITVITYSLQPTATSSDAFVTSNVYNVMDAESLIDLVPAGTAVGAFLPNLIPATGATIKLFDKYGLERTFGIISKDDKLEVTAADGVTKKTYYISELSLLPQDYLAYVLSSVYTVDQIELSIAGSINFSTLVSELIGNLTPAQYATVRCTDLSGNGKATNVNLAVGDRIEVTSGDGNATVYYSIDGITTSVITADNKAQINVYPNPTTGNLYISGLDKDSRICVYNILGELVLNKTSHQSNELIALNKLLKGVYFVKVFTKGKTETRKVILK